jgi:hypothetical protein
MLKLVHDTTSCLALSRRSFGHKIYLA